MLQVDGVVVIQHHECTKCHWIVTWISPGFTHTPQSDVLTSRTSQVLEVRSPECNTLARLCSSWRPQGEAHSLSFPASRSPLYCLVCGLSLHLQIPASLMSASNSHLLLLLALLRAASKDPCDYVGFTYLIKNTFPISKSSSPLQVPFAVR